MDTCALGRSSGAERFGPPRRATVLEVFPPPSISIQARSVSETLQAWAMQPRGVKGGSPSKISARLPTP